MEEIKFSTGKREFRLNDQVSVAFNPTDAAFVERIYDVFEKLDAEQQTYRSEMEASSDKRKIFDIAHQHDEKMRDMIDGLFEAPACAALFGSMNVYALADGLPVWANLMLAVLDQVDTTLTQEKLRTNPRIQKYTERWAKK